MKPKTTSITNTPKKKTTSLHALFTGLLMLGCVIAGLAISGMLYQQEASAGRIDSVTYKEWDSEAGSFVDAVCEDYTVLMDSDGVYNEDADEVWEPWSAGTYVVNSNVTITARIRISDTVNLILCDGYKLTASKGITVPNGTTLNIYAQSAGTGTLEAIGEKKQAGIGGDGTVKKWNSCGAVNIHGGIINSQGGNYGAGIGGCKYQRYSNSDEEGSNGGNVTIYGGDITAAGGIDAAGIGGGGVGEWIEFWSTGSGGIVTINGGNVKAIGKNGGAGIGGGSFGDGGTVIINDGIVEAYSVNGGAGIGGGSDNIGTKGDGAEVTINGGTVTATGTSGSAGIGGGGYGSGGKVTINGGKVTATGGEFTNSSGTVRGMGIGMGAWSSSAYENGDLIVDARMIIYSNDEPITDENKNSIEEKKQGNGKASNITRKQYMFAEPGKLHTHSFSYAANGAAITAKCTEGCLNGYDTNGFTVTLSAPENLAYNGTAKAATISGYPETDIENLAEAPTSVSYYLSKGKGSTVPDGDALTGAPTNSGDYVAQMVWGGQTASLAFTITKLESAIDTNPTAKELKVNGSAQELVNEGTASGGTLKYALGADAYTAPADGWSESVPAGTDEGTYYVWYKVVGDGNHNDTEPACIIVTIAGDEDVNSVINAINALPEQPSVNDKEAIEGARAAYEALTDAQKALVSEEVFNKLKSAENLLAAAIEAATAATPDPGTQTPGTQTPGTQTPGTQAPGTQTPNAQPPSTGDESSANSGIIDPTLPKIKLSKPKAAKKSITVKWKKLKKNQLKKVKGIEVEYSLTKDFKNSTFKKTGKKKANIKLKKLLSKKTYYIRVRTYVQKSGKKYVSGWSVVKKAKAK